MIIASYVNIYFTCNNDTSFNFFYLFIYFLLLLLFFRILKKKASIPKNMKKSYENCFDFEKGIIGAYQTLYSQNIQPHNPFSSHPYAFCQLEISSICNEVPRIINIIQVLQLPKYDTFFETWWNIVKPDNVRKLLNTLAQKHGFCLQSQRLYFSALFRLLWIYHDSSFLSCIPFDLKTINGSLLQVGQWYEKQLPATIKKAKLSQKQRNGKQMDRWVDAAEFQSKYSYIKERILNDDVTFIELREFVVFLFYVSIPPLRTQNIKVIVLPSLENRTQEDMIQDVEEYNKSVSFVNYARDKHTGVICEKPLQNGSYYLACIDYKTKKTFGFQQFKFSHPTTKLIFKEYFKRRPDPENLSFLQKKNGTTLLYPGNDFQNICEKFFGKRISPSNYRKITTTRIELESDDMIKKFAKQLLHSVKIAKETYVWEDLNDQIANTSQIIETLGDSSIITIQQYVEEFENEFSEIDEELMDDVFGKILCIIQQAKTKKRKRGEEEENNEPKRGRRKS